MIHFFLICLYVCQARAFAVFAHFMVSNTANYTLGDWEDDIQKARDASINAFALNVAYDDPTNDFALPMAFEAASNVGSFSLFFSFDYAGNGPWPKNTVTNMILEYSQHASYYRYESKPFVSTFEGPGNAKDWISIKLQSGCFFIPDWSSLGAKEALEAGGGGIVDGLFSWAAWPWGPNDMDTYTDASYLRYLNQTGSSLPYMMPVSPWFYTNLPGYGKNWLWRGDHLWRDRWLEAWYVRPEFIQIISWNDYGESHYIGPLRSDAMEAFDIGKAPFNYATGMPHDGWRTEVKYLADTYKHGSATVDTETLPMPVGQEEQLRIRQASFSLNSTPAKLCEIMSFFSALLSEPADVSVTIGGEAVEAIWRNTPDIQAGIYYGYAPVNSHTGEVIVTAYRGTGNNIAQVKGEAITTSCTNGLANWNAWVGSTQGSVSASYAIDTTTQTPLGDLVCVNGTGANNFADLCNFSCKYGYCPVSACTCVGIGEGKEKPNATGVQGYPQEGLGAAYSGVCSFDCNYGYCPDDACATAPSGPLATPTTSPFAPPACIAGTGEGNLAGLCSFSCSFGFCPLNSCTCKEQGSLAIKDPTNDFGATAASTEDEDIYGPLCSFACQRGYCPFEACTIQPNLTPKEVAALESDFTAALELSDYNISNFEAYDLGDLATRLVGWSGCSKLNGTDPAEVYSGWQQSWNLMNHVYNVANKGIDFNEAAAVEYLGPPGLNQDQQSDFNRIFKNIATIQPGFRFNPFSWRLGVRCDDPKRMCTCGVGTETMAYTIPRDRAYGIATINFCPGYFHNLKLRDVMKNANKELGAEYYGDMFNYVPNQGKTWFHELLHVDWVSQAKPKIYDIKIVVTVLNGEGEPENRQYGAYGPRLTKSLARWGFMTGEYTIRNADSLTMYALTKYVQKELGNIYPHLPLAPEPPKRATLPLDGSFVIPHFVTIYADGTAELADNTTVVDNLLWDQGVCATGDEQISGGNPDNPDYIVSFSNAEFAPKSEYPSAYLSSWSSWAGLTPTTTTTSSAPRPTATWTMKIYKNHDCSGDHYSLEGHHLDNLHMECHAIHSGLTTDMSSSDVSCRWYTDGGNSWMDCDSSTLTHPLSWRVEGGLCTVYSNDQCEDQGYFQTYDSEFDCNNFSKNDFDVKKWIAFSCGAISDDALRALYKPARLSLRGTSPSSSTATLAITGIH